MYRNFYSVGKKCIAKIYNCIANCELRYVNSRLVVFDAFPSSVSSTRCSSHGSISVLPVSSDELLGAFCSNASLSPNCLSNWQSVQRSSIFQNHLCLSLFFQHISHEPTISTQCKQRFCLSLSCHKQDTSNVYLFLFTCSN